MLKCTVRNCIREFRSAQALAMHKFRAHGVKKRKKNRRQKELETNRTVELNHCPQCGTNLRMLAAALRALRGL